jgi:hypothetical protein
MNDGQAAKFRLVVLIVSVEIATRAAAKFGTRPAGASQGFTDG